MTFTAHINVMPLKELLDPQGKAVMSGLKNLGITQINDVRIGKHITLHIEAATKEEAQTLAENACQKLLANQVMESFEVTIQ
ncbi:MULTISPECIES: phosphoribosylformylglycinamidine synthase subunit PurS [unclassified Chitinophaga]|jgi:phosphoribosylformylglycinamidine synthase|uniref:phosphoribosylformylglycinamidine synthase subunit PurS n=1 Tax=unclassified Chitinophaga TaxID=2619133 RepID=UPI0009CA1C3D|nr:MULTISPECIES: phosphoribosylformylglycinamidine synthase subunit PurS [unclassified Chitinophaga]OMP76903.1 phosphoribosylformylglycinamidine synthase [[Flexibacter] sp. ATCC 35208]WPV67342.1 phosphoribosylformylglycinamidine synthase subunit PurS [Chitinophaga sp. LS1]